MPTRIDWAAGSHRFRKWNYFSLAGSIGLVAVGVVLGLEDNLPVVLLAAFGVVQAVGALVRGSRAARALFYLSLVPLIGSFLALAAAWSR